MKTCNKLECTLHKDNPSECPQNHFCKCGYPLNEHISVATWCPTGKGKQYRPNANTLAQFPWLYHA